MKARDKIRKWLLLCVAMAFWGGIAHAAELPSSPADTCHILAYCNPPEAGTITGSESGDYAIGTRLTFTAEANQGYYFSNWTNGFGEIVSVSKTYSFVVTYHCVLFANFTSHPDIGSLVTNADGSQGVLFHINATGTEGWMVALNDASSSCQWGDNSDVLALHEIPFNLPMALEDQSGYLNTNILRNLQAPESGYAATHVDFDNGWYLPSVGQLRKLYSALPFIEAALTDADGSTLSEGDYWSSSEYSSGQAFSLSFALNSSNKGSGCRVRAIRNYVMAGDNAVVVASDNTNYGTVTGGGSYANGQTVTVTAMPNPGYAFDYWSEDGMAVSYDAQYQFTFTRSRSLVAHFVVPGSVGSIIVNADGSKGVVFWQSPEGDEGLMVALEDASNGCTWSPNGNALTLVDKPFQLPIALEDVSGNTNTRCIRKHLDALSGVYAANVVDFEHGWYLPSAGELRKLYAALPLIENALSLAGGVTLTNSTYWSSTEYGSGQAATATFSMGNENKGSTLPVRAIRHFSTAGPQAIALKANDATLGTLSGSGNYTYGQSVTVTATPNPGYAFNYWTENGMIVSYDAAYQFPFTGSRSLVAHFVIPGSVGSVVNNVDGSKGVVFWQSPEGDEGLMMALEDASNGCKWSPNGNALTLIDRPYTLPIALEDVSGNTNTRCILNHLDSLSGFAANMVDFEHGWYLPSAGELRKLYAAMPQVEPVLLNAGGVMLTGNTYWSSTEYSSGQVATATFSMSNENKGSTLPVRAIRHFSTAGPNAIAVKANDATLGSVSGADEYSNGQSVTVTATPNAGYAFNYWTENGMIVSFDAEYAFTFTRSRSLVANFILENSVGSVITNADGSRGVVFWQSPDGDEFLMVALEDVSEGCQWGPNRDTPLEDWPSATPELLNDMDGQSNTQILREWFENNPDYAACKTDFENGWYLPSAGQSRKLYAALPIVERVIINAGGRLMTENSYWSSTERGSGTAWTPMFAMNYDNKGGSCRVRAIYSVKNEQMVTQTIELSEGWNWVSLYVVLGDPVEALQMLEAALGDNATVISGSELYTEYYGGGFWIGDLDDEGITNEQMYMIEVANDCEIELEGVVANPADHAITINPGWNWIGFPCGQELSLEEALADFEAEDGDQLTEAELYTEYGFGMWIGDVAMLVPGRGYMYYSNSTQPKTLAFPSTSKGKNVFLQKRK